MCKRQKQTIVELLAALKADLENERVAEHALAVLDVDEADGDHTHSCDRALESTMTTFCGKASRKQGKKRHSTKNARTRQKTQVNSNTRNKQKSQVFHATARQRNSAKASWLVRPFSGFLASPNELSIETIEQKIVHIIADNVLECGAESHLVLPSWLLCFCPRSPPW